MSFDFSKLTEEQAMGLMYPKQLEAYKACRFGRGNILITASGGFGKSFIIEALMYYSKGDTVATATSGVAANAIEGCTTHSCLAMPLGIPTKQDLSKTSKRYKSLFKRKHPIKNLIVDEISMMGPETLDSFIQRLTRVSRSAKSKNVRCLLFGDFFQLLNVVKQKDKRYILAKYGTTKLLECDMFKTLDLEIFELDQNKRAIGGDKEFVDRLEDVRNGRNLEECCEYFNQQVEKVDPDAIYITTKNDVVDKINKKYFDANPNQEFHFSASVSGDFKVKDSKLEETLVLKEGLRVMSLVNDTEDDRFVNGSLGVITNLLCDQIEVTFDNGVVAWIEPTIEEKKEYYTDEEGELCHKVVGTMTGYGLRQSNAITGHKSQSLGFDKATIDLSEGSFCSGQVYTMLSRLTNIRGLTLTSPLKVTDILTDESIKKFYSELRGEVYAEPIPKGYEQYKIRLIVAGGRDFSDYNYLCKSLDFMLKNYKPSEILIVSGKAKGADSLGERYAGERGITVKDFKANWKDLTTQPVKIRSNTYGEYNCLAGIVRNHEMGDFASHAVVYWDGVSTGSKDMQDYMKDQCKPVKVFSY